MRSVLRQWRRITRSQTGQRSLVLSVILAVILSLCLVLFLPFGGQVTAEDIQSCLDSLDAGPTDFDSVRGRAYGLAGILFDDAGRRDRFADEVADLYFASRDIDFLLVYNTGGFAGATMAEDPEWPSVLEGIRETLAPHYDSMIVEYQRGEGGFVDFLGQVEEIKQDYAGKAPELAAKIAFLTKYNPDLNVIVTGRCFGAIFSNEVLEILAGNNQVYSVQAGRPFWYTDPADARSLVIENNGVMPDILSTRGALFFLWELGKANLGQLPSTSPDEDGSFKALNWYLRAPGHKYTWDHAGVRSAVLDFLEQRFLNSE